MSVRVVLDLLDQFANTSSQLVSQQNVALQVFGNQCSPRSALVARHLARDLRHGRQRVSRAIKICFIFNVEALAVIR